VNASPGSFGYNEATHQFSLPPPTGRPELTVYASRAVSDTGVQRGPVGFASPPAAFTNNGTVYTPISFSTNSAGENVTLNVDLGLKLILPLPPLGKLSATLSLGADFKRFQQTSYNTNENTFVLQYTDPQGNLRTITSYVPVPLTTTESTLNYLPLNAGLSGSLADKLGTTFFNANANFNVMPGFSDGADFAKVSYAGAKAHANYVTVQLGADRVQTLHKDWSLKLHADGQWANTALIGDEQYSLGGTPGVRGYQYGAAYGDTGWRVSVEPQLPPIDLGMFGNEGDEESSWLRGSVFMDYGETYLLEPSSGTSGSESFWGLGWAATINLGSHLDGRVAMAWPLTSSAQTRIWDLHLYFGVGAQF
jgi:hemolysin activation/secretion protein